MNKRSIIFLVVAIAIFVVAVIKDVWVWALIGFIFGAGVADPLGALIFEVIFSLIDYWLK